MSTPRAPAPSQAGDDGDRSSDAVTVRRVEFPALSDTARPAEPLPPDVLADVDVSVAAVLGAARMTVREILGMRPGTLIHLDSLAGQSVELRVNNVPVAGGEVIVVDDQYAVRLNTIGTNRHRSPDYRHEPGKDALDEPSEG
jgi:flagellar motor switch protein FliN/FliY